MKFPTEYGPAISSRSEQRDATRARLLDIAVGLLIDRGYAGTSTVEVQKAAGVSRGGLLHHFPTRADLITAVIRRLLELHEAAAREAMATVPDGTDRLRWAIDALDAVIRRPAFVAQMDLWAAARTDAELAEVVSREERRAGSDLTRVVDELFGRPLTEHPHYRMVADLTIQLLRGLALTDVLRGDAATARSTLDDWADMVRSRLAPLEDPR